MTIHIENSSHFTTWRCFIHCHISAKKRKILSLQSAQRRKQKHIRDHISCNVPYLPPKILHNICFSFLLAAPWLLQNFWGKIRCIMGDLQVAYGPEKGREEGRGGGGLRMSPDWISQPVLCCLSPFHISSVLCRCFKAIFTITDLYLARWLEGLNGVNR